MRKTLITAAWAIIVAIEVLTFAGATRIHQKSSKASWPYGHDLIALLFFSEFKVNLNLKGNNF